MNYVDCGNGTPYQTAGRGDEQVRGLILHATAGTVKSDHPIFMGDDDARQVSIHYYILKTGEIREYVRDDDTAWHTGDSAFHGFEDFDCNLVTLGTELENLNTGTDPYPQAQYDAAVWLWRSLIATYSIPREWCARHLDISPGRKTDPAGFPWSQFLDDCYNAPVVSYERRYRVKYNRSVVRTGPARSFPVVSYLPLGSEFLSDSAKWGEVVENSDVWIHFASGAGFIHSSAVEWLV